MRVSPVRCPGSAAPTPAGCSRRCATRIAGSTRWGSASRSAPSPATSSPSPTPSSSTSACSCGSRRSAAPSTPGSEAHDLAMTLFGSQSKGERMRIKTRVRAAMGAQTALQGRYLGGRPPYGYRLADAGAHPNPAKARFGARLHVLEPDRTTAPVVRRIYAEFLQGAGYLAIAERLNAEQLPSPSGHDPARNPHRQGIGWTKHTVRAILVNPRYTQCRSVTTTPPCKHTTFAQVRTGT